ncbi:DMT family transporter [Staphylococcus simulans]|uniref:DMT family transporter n=1 Tax=Staphylococcus simulans TaxID=1286 RepID=UPI001E5EBC56|nr:DMT family transporter [Staphylococcus simulans]MCD8914336.1 DMT family transporter [Staphylococcus simulans]
MQLRQNNLNLFYFSVIFSTIFMGSSFPTGKYLISIEHAPPFFIGGWRFLIAGLMMILVTMATNGTKSAIPTTNKSFFKGWTLVSTIGLLQTTGTMGFLNLAMAHGLSSSVSSIILFTNPLWLAVLAHFILNDHLNIWKFFALLLGISGVIICLGLDKTAFGIGAFYALLGSFCWSLNTIVTKTIPFDKGPWIFTGWQLTMGGLFMLFLAVINHEEYNLLTLNFNGWFDFIWLIIPASIGSFGLWFLSLRLGGATITSSFLFLVPVFSTIFSIIWLHEPFTISLIIGGILVVVSLVLVNKQKNNKGVK